MTLFNTGKRSNIEQEYFKMLGEFIEQSPVGAVDKFQNFPVYTPRQTIAMFMVKERIFEKILNVQGSIIEGGVLFGQGLKTWEKLSSILEPFNYQRRIYGFDTFEGFPSLSETDKKSYTEKEMKVGGMGYDSYDELQRSITLDSMNRPIGHIPKSELVRGDACQTMPKFLEEHPHLIVSLLYLDFDLEEPTRVALETFLKRMPKGAVIGFDEINNPKWPGETKAVFDIIGLRNLRIQRFPFASYISYAVIE